MLGIYIILLCLLPFPPVLSLRECKSRRAVNRICHKLEFIQSINSSKNLAVVNQCIQKVSFRAIWSDEGKNQQYCPKDCRQLLYLRSEVRVARLDVASKVSEVRKWNEFHGNFFSYLHLLQQDGNGNGFFFVCWPSPATVIWVLEHSLGGAVEVLSHFH